MNLNQTSELAQCLDGGVQPRCRVYVYSASPKYKGFASDRAKPTCHKRAQKKEACVAVLRPPLDPSLEINVVQGLGAAALHASHHTVLYSAYADTLRPFILSLQERRAARGAEML